MALSYAHGAVDEPLLGCTIDQQLTETASRIPDLPALIVRHQNVRYTWRQLKQTVDSATAELRQSLQQEHDRAEALETELVKAWRYVGKLFHSAALFAAAHP